jgi:hypothetical protein
MGARKLEEGDWADVYGRAKGIPNRGWSNLQIDVMHNGLGVEQKMLRVESVRAALGSRKMHPAATRSIRIPERTEDPHRVMAEVLSQYAELIEQRRKRVRETSPHGKADLRTGWLLWQDDLTEFAYFEEEMIAPNPSAYRAEWHSSGGGSRKRSRNLWIFEKNTGIKRYSVTTQAGAKIQPYFDIPRLGSDELYLLRVQGFRLGDGRVRLSVSHSTAQELAAELGTLAADRVEAAISSVYQAISAGTVDVLRDAESFKEIDISEESYRQLCESFPVANDDLRMQQLSEHYHVVAKPIAKERPS